MLRRLLRVVVAVAGALLANGSLQAAPPADSTGAPNPEFVKQVDLSQFRLMAVQHEGCFKTFDTLARSSLRHLSGDDTFQWEEAGRKTGPTQDAVFTFLDIMFRPRAYHDARIVYVKEKVVLDRLVLPVKDQLDPKLREAVFADQRVSLSFLAMPEVQAALSDLSSDVMRTARKVNILLGNAAYSDPRMLQRQMRVIPPQGARSQQERWCSIEELQMGMLPDDPNHAGMSAARPLPGTSPELQQQLTDQWTALQQAWVSQDATGVNAAADTLAKILRTINPGIYPAESKLSLEHWYYGNNKLMWSWSIYFLAVIFLLMGIVYRWRTAVIIGACIFAVGFGFHTAACAIRWYLAGRIPNSNMFEAVTAAAWFGCAVATCFEIGPFLHRHRASWAAAWAMAAGGLIVWLGSLQITGVPVSAWQQWSGLSIAALIVFAVGCMMVISLVAARRAVNYRGVPLFAAAVVGMVALMCGQFMKVSLDSDIGRTMPILNDLWLYVHTNMVIASYALIGLAFCTAALSLVGRMLTMSWTWEKSWPVWVFIVLPAFLMPLVALPDLINRAVALFRSGPDLFNWPLPITQVISAWAPFLIVMGMYAVARFVRFLSWTLAGRARAVWDGVATLDFPTQGQGGVVPVAVGSSSAGVSALHSFSRSGTAMMSGEAVPHAAAAPKAMSLAKVFDGATMLLLELSFIMLWTGIIMGAIWADHSWGRPWGWDPKEVFALNTWIIFLVLVHVRLKVVDKELWTAVLAVLGAAVMMFNWVVVNFFIVGLHSYA